MAKKYRVVRNFSYHGPDGKKKVGISIGPGEEVPKLDESECERFLHEGAIVQLDMYGENIPNKKVEELTDEKIDVLLRKNPRIIATVIKSANYGEKTLGKIYTEAEKRKLSPPLLDLIESKIK